MARKKNEKVVLENIELKPQVLGYTFRKKNNIGRVIFIFIAFILVVYYIDDISVFFNNLLGRKTPSTISSNANNNNNNNNNNSNENENKEETEYYTYSNDLKINFENLTIDNFNINKNVLSFDINNLTLETIDVGDQNIFLETFDENKTMIDRFKLDINTVANNSKISLNLDIKKDFNYLTIKELKEEEYPPIVLDANDNGESTIVCKKDKETITYTFKDASLVKINHKIIDNEINGVNYNTNLNSYQSKVNSYKQIEGVDATFTSSLNGYNVDVTLDLAKVDLSKINEKYYYAYHKDAKIINYEMTTYGFTCN